MNDLNIPDQPIEPCPVCLSTEGLIAKTKWGTTIDGVTVLDAYRACIGCGRKSDLVESGNA